MLNEPSLKCNSIAICPLVPYNRIQFIRHRRPINAIRSAAIAPKQRSAQSAFDIRYTRWDNEKNMNRSSSIPRSWIAWPETILFLYPLSAKSLIRKCTSDEWSFNNSSRRSVQRLDAYTSTSRELGMRDSRWLFLLLVARDDLKSDAYKIGRALTRWKTKYKTVR